MATLLDVRLSTFPFNWTASRCQAAAPIFVDVAINSMDASNVGIDAVVNFLQLLPAPFNQSEEGELCEFWTKSWRSDSVANNMFVQNISMNCQKEVCDNVPRGGNPDITGIGVSSFLVDSAFAIAFGAPSGAAMVKPAPNHDAPSRPESRDGQGLPGGAGSHRNIWERSFDPFSGIITALFDICLPFTLAVELSTLAFHSQAVSRYEMVIAELVCVFFSSACITLWVLLLGMARFRIARFGLYLLTWPLLIAIVVVHNTMPMVDGIKGLVMICLHDRMGRYTDKPWRDYTLFSLWGFVSIVHILVVLQGVDLRMIERKSYPRAIVLGKWLALITPLLSCGLMIWCLAETVKLREKMKEMAGSQYNEHLWGVGQVFALGIGISILLPFSYSLCCKSCFLSYSMHGNGHG
jgi:hypothetical protein